MRKSKSVVKTVGADRHPRAEPDGADPARVRVQSQHAPGDSGVAERGFSPVAWYCPNAG